MVFKREIGLFYVLGQKKFWNTRWRQFRCSSRITRTTLQAIVFLTFVRMLWPAAQHPVSISAPAERLVLPSPGQDALSFAHEHAQSVQLPVYVLYKARSGQLNNQLISFINALAIAKAANATLVAPFAFYGSESLLDSGSGRGIGFYFREYRERLWGKVLQLFDVYYPYDELLATYLDPDLLNDAQPVIGIVDFLRSNGCSYLRTFQHVLTRRGDAHFFHMTLGRRSIWSTNVNVRREAVDSPSTKYPLPVAPASRRDLDCNFNISDYFRGLPHSDGANGNYLFLSKLYRSHSLNCSLENPHWLLVRRKLQPRSEIRDLVTRNLRRWGSVLSIHLRLFPYDSGKYTADAFCSMLLTHYKHQVESADHLYIAYSVTSVESVEVVQTLRSQLGASKIKTAADYGVIYKLGKIFDKPYVIPLVDMWTCVQGDNFIGRLGSSLSWNVVYWREALRISTLSRTNAFYSLEDFSPSGEKNPTDVYNF